MKQRLDQVLMDRGLFSSREKARSAIMNGRVLVAGRKETKAGTPVPSTAAIAITGEDLPYVSRGGLKLEKALNRFSIDLKNKTIVDVGASTGGFTHCALLHGAKKVYAVDVGYGQLAWELRQDQRVVVLEKTNARYLSAAQIPEKADGITIDASFISLTKLLPPLLPLLRDDGFFLALIKPQFEAGREKVGKKGVVRDSNTHIEVTHTVLTCGASLGLLCTGLTHSPIRGPEGNIEYLARLEKKGTPLAAAAVDETVAAAFLHFSAKPAAN